MVDAIDRENSRHWAISPSASLGIGPASAATFLLVNRETGREHALIVPTGGLSFEFDASVGAPDYVLFNTKKPVNFNDFDGCGARLTSLNVGLIFGYSVAYLTIWKDSAYASDELAYVEMSGGAFMLPGGSVGHGVTMVHYGDGERSGTVPLILNIEEDIEPSPPLVRIRVDAMEDPIIVLPDDVLFDFDKSTLKSSAVESLRDAADKLNTRRTLPVTIEGHTDSTGPSDYNQDLSERRAQAVKDWFVDHGVDQAETFKVVGKGESEPTASNSSDEGRQKNRRVEIKYR
ncbi:MAG: OmpA family protein [Pseudomonadota bacterium]